MSSHFDGLITFDRAQQMLHPSVQMKTWNLFQSAQRCRLFATGEYVGPPPFVSYFEGVFLADLQRLLKGQDVRLTLAEREVVWLVEQDGEEILIRFGQRDESSRLGAFCLRVCPLAARERAEQA